MVRLLDLPINSCFEFDGMIYCRRGYHDGSVFCIPVSDPDPDSASSFVLFDPSAGSSFPCDFLVSPVLDSDLVRHLWCD